MTDYRSYVFSEGTDAERQQMLFLALKPKLEQTIAPILDDYGLANTLKTANTPRTILEYGVGEGLYLHEVAAILEKRDLLAAAHLAGVEGSSAAIATAEDYKQVSKPPRPYLQFFIHDFSQPLSGCYGLNTVSPRFEFDFIYSMSLLSYLSNVKEQVRKIYQALKPSGSLLLRGFNYTEGEEGWIAPHPFVQKTVRVIFDTIAKRNPGQVFPQQTPEWLKEFGAEQITTKTLVAQVGGTGQEGRYMLRHTLLAVQNARPLIIKSGAVTNEEFEEGWKQMYSELTPQHLGQLTFVDIYARKPEM